MMFSITMRLMRPELSKRLFEIVEALPLKRGIRVLEIGCGPGAMAREISRRIGEGTVLGIDRSAKAIRQAKAGAKNIGAGGKLYFRQAAVEKFELGPGELPFDIAVAVRVGVLDGRHPEMEEQALQCIAKALAPSGRLFTDGGHPLKEILLDDYR